MINRAHASPPLPPRWLLARPSQEHLWAQLEATVERVHSEYLHMEAQARQLERKVNDVLVVNDKAAAAAASASNIVAAAAAASAGARAKRAVSTRHLPVGGSSNITNTAKVGVVLVFLFAWFSTFSLVVPQLACTHTTNHNTRRCALDPLPPPGNALSFDKGTSHSRPLDTSSTAFASDQRGLPQQRLLMNRHVASAAAASPTTRAPAPSSGLAITADESRALAPRDASLLSNHHLQKSAGLACNCKKSKCLKLYCDCFSAGTTCGSSCKCQNCQNDDPNGAARALSMRNIVRRNPYAFKPKVRCSGGGGWIGLGALLCLATGM